MAFETAVILACLAAALAAACCARAQFRRAARLEAELETLRDAQWASVEREAHVRKQGELALEEAHAAAAAGVRAKSRFLATVTHEMRTPLSGVIGTADLLLGTRLAPDQRTYARAVQSSAEAMLALVDEILDLSRIEADRPSLQTAPFQVTALVEDVAELLAPRAQAKGLDLAVLIARTAPAEITGDVARVRQILLNLAGNAIKFTTRGGVGLRVDAVEGGVRFSVVDTGPGFDPGEIGRLFEEFEQGGADPAAGGVGLGLAISRRLAEAMGGELDCDAAPGAGAAFALTLPHEGGAQPAAATLPLEGRRAVVVSNTPFTGPWLVENLSALGADAVLFAAEDAPKGLSAAVAAHAAEIVLIDRGSAASPRAHVAAARRGGAGRVLLMLTPSERQDLARFMAKGFDGYLVKPLRAASLVSRVTEPRAGADPIETVEAAATPSVFPSSGGLDVLVAEDDPVSALIALAHLTRLGHASTHVPDGLSACEAFARGAFDAVLLDLRMPGLDGYMAARRIREIEAAENRSPALVVALTANVGGDDRAAALDAGMDELLAKPLDRGALEGLLARRVTRGMRVA